MLADVVFEIQGTVQFLQSSSFVLISYFNFLFQFRVFWVKE